MLGEDAKRLARMGLSSEALRLPGERLLWLPRIGDDLFDREGEALPFLLRLGVWKLDSLRSGDADGDGSKVPTLALLGFAFVFVLVFGGSVVVVVVFFFFLLLALL